MEADGPTPADVDGLAEIFEKTLLEVSILGSLHGSSAASDRVERVFRASVQDLRESGTLKTLAAAMTFVDGGRARRRARSRDGCAEREPSPRGDVESLEKRLRALRRNADEVDSMTEKCIEDGEHRVIRRETEKYYVTKWEKARVENYKFQFIAKELEQRKKIADLQTKLETAKIVDLENTKYLDYSINELEQQIKYWESKYETDTKEIEKKLENLKTILKEKTVEVETLKETYDERQATIDEHVTNKQKLEEEKKLNEFREKMAIKIQAWWRGTMVRRRLGSYKHLLGPRKKSIKKSMTSKGNKTKIKYSESDI